MPRRIPLPNKAMPLLEADGQTVAQAWFDWFSYLDRQIAAGLSGQVDVKLSALANGQVLVWNSTDSKWENGAN